MKRHLLLILLLGVFAAQCFAYATDRPTPLRISIEQKDSFGIEGEMSLRVTTLTSDDLPPGDTFESLGRMACADAFVEVPDAIDTGIMDGHFTHIVIEWADGTTVRKGGLIAEEFGPPAFRELYAAILRAVPSGESAPLDVDSILADYSVVRWTTADGYLYVLENIILPYESYIPEHQLWRIRLRDGMREDYSLGNVADFALWEDHLFVIYVDREGFDRIDLDGANLLHLPIKPYVFFFEDDWLYYLAYENGQSAAYRCHADCKGIEPIAQGAAQSQPLNEAWLRQQALADQGK